MSNRGPTCPLWSWPPPPGCWPLGLGSTGHGAVTGAGDQGVGRGHCPCLGMDLRIFGRGPCASRCHRATQEAPPLPSYTQPLGVPRIFAGQVILRSGSQGLNVPEDSAVVLALSEAGTHTEVTATQSRGPALCHLPCQDRVQESISLFFKNKNKTKNG